MPAPSRFSRHLLAAALLVASPLAAEVGRWHSWSNLAPVKALLEHRGRLYAGTSGGVRSVDPATFKERFYDNLSGLTDVRVVGLAAAADGRLWAASRSGGLFMLDGDRWEGFGRSYQSSGWTINDRAFFAAGPYLVIGSEKGLSFFDRRSKLAAANLTKFGAEGVQPVTGLLRRGDTLYIATGKAVLRAAVDFENVLSSKFGTIFDPQIWKAAADVANPIDLPSFADAVNTLPADTAIGDTVDGRDTFQGKPVHLALIDGRVTAHAAGALLRSAAHRARGLSERRLFIDGETYADSLTEAFAEAGGRLFIGSPGGLAWLKGKGDLDTLPVPRPFPIRPIGSISARDGMVVAQTPREFWILDGKDWRIHLDFSYESGEVLRNELRNVRVGSDRATWLGSWGEGIIRFAPGSLRKWNTDTDPDCLKPRVEPNYTVVQSLDIRGDDMWISLLEDPHGGEIHTHHLAHMDIRTGKVTCPDIKGDGSQVTSIRILSHDLLSVAGNDGIHLYRWGKRDGKVFASHINALAKGTGEALGRDAAFDGRGRLWGLFSEQLGMLDTVANPLSGSSLPLLFPPNIKVKTCRDMETDPRGGLWVGCDNGLFHVVSTGDSSAPEVVQYTTSNGLLANRIFDVSVDPSNGDVWVAGEGGINRLEGPSPPLVSGVSKVRAYPNPFLGRHAVLVLDNMPRNAEAAILTQGGSVVRSFRSRDLLGNQFQWDGKNAAGRKVKPGVYLYRVDAGGKTTHGKIIVAR